MDVPVVFLHGLGGFPGVWHKQRPEFSSAVYLALPGHPDGTPLPSMEAMAGWLHLTLSDRVRGKFVLCGHSMGAALSLLYAVTWPEDLAGLVAVDGSARISAPSTSAEALRQQANDLNAYRLRLEESFKRLPAVERAPLIDKMLRISPETRLADMIAINAFDLTGRVGEIKASTLVMAGSGEPAGLQKFEALASRIPNGRFQVIEGAGHYPMLDQPEAFNRVLGEFLSGLGEPDKSLISKGGH